MFLDPSHAGIFSRISLRISEDWGKLKIAFFSYFRIFQEPPEINCSTEGAEKHNFSPIKLCSCNMRNVLQ